jgi:tetratricopeptide (TPR) repeat protein
MTYQDFDLLIERASEGFSARVLKAAGEPSVRFALPFTDVKLENFLLRLGRTRRAMRRIESSEMQAAKTFGAALFNAVFSGDVAGAFKDRVEAARRTGEGVRIRLRLADAELADLPWEYLYNPAVNRFLALSVHTPLVRYMDLPDPIQPIPITPPIRALVMIASPSDYPSLDVEAEWNKLTASLADLLANGQIAIDRMDDATLPALQRKLRKSQYHILHFIGHGEFDQSLQEGVLLLEDEQHRGHRVGSQYLGMMLHDHESLRVAILNACEGARTSRLDPFAGTAQTLVQQGIPAVIAMQFEIADDVASTFAHEFYGALADGYPIDAALTEARKAIFADGRDVEWGTPVLYLRAPDGRIFDVAQQAVAARPTTTMPLAEPAASRTRITEASTGKERAAELLQSADVALANGDYVEALRFLEQARALDPQATALGALTDTAEQQRAVAETRTQRREAFLDHLAVASELLRKRDLTAALQRVRDALHLKPNDPDAVALQTQIRQALDSVKILKAPEAPRESVKPGPSPFERDVIVGSETEAPKPERDEAINDERDLIDPPASQQMPKLPKVP